MSLHEQREKIWKRERTMKPCLNRTKSESTLEARLREINLPPYERLAAQAHLARAEALSDVIVGTARGIRSLVRAAGNLFAWPKHRAS